MELFTEPLDKIFNKIVKYHIWSGFYGSYDIGRYAADTRRGEKRPRFIQTKIMHFNADADVYMGQKWCNSEACDVDQWDIYKCT